VSRRSSFRAKGLALERTFEYVELATAEKRTSQMTIRFTARHMIDGTKHEHIANLRWVKDGETETKSSSRETLVDWVKNKGGKGYVADKDGNKAYVKVIEADPPYLQTERDGILTDNLLALPTY
jgi:hypothetical protein